MRSSAARQCAFQSHAPLVSSIPPIRRRFNARHYALRPRCLPRRRPHTVPLARADNGSGGQCEGRSADYWVNLGTVIDTLREDIPRMAAEDPDYSVYAPNIVFADRSGNRVVGLEAYRRVLWAIRTQLKLFFCNTYVFIQSLYHDDYEGAIYVRWRISTTPRWLALSGGAAATPWVYDGLSVYILNSNGLVAQHLLENNARSRHAQRIKFRKVHAVSTARATPAGAGLGVPTWYSAEEWETNFLEMPSGGAHRSDEIFQVPSDTGYRQYVIGKLFPLSPLNESLRKQFRPGDSEHDERDTHANMRMGTCILFGDSMPHVVSLL